MLSSIYGNKELECHRKGLTWNRDYYLSVAKVNYFYIK